MRSSYALTFEQFEAEVLIVHMPETSSPQVAGNSSLLSISIFIQIPNNLFVTNSVVIVYKKSKNGRLLSLMQTRCGVVSIAAIMNSSYCN